MFHVFSAFVGQFHQLTSDSVLLLSLLGLAQLFQFSTEVLLQNFLTASLVVLGQLAGFVTTTGEIIAFRCCHQNGTTGTTRTRETSSYLATRIRPT